MPFAMLTSSYRKKIKSLLQTSGATLTRQIDRSLRKKPVRQHRRTFMIVMPYHAKELMQVDYQLYEQNLDVEVLLCPLPMSSFYVDL